MRSNQQFYQIVLDGHIGLDWSLYIDKVGLEHTQDGKTVLTGGLPDQTALHGVLIRIRDLGLSLVEIKRIEYPNQ